MIKKGYNKNDYYSFEEALKLIGIERKEDLSYCLNRFHVTQNGKRVILVTKKSVHSYIKERSAKNGRHGKAWFWVGPATRIKN